MGYNVYMAKQDLNYKNHGQVREAIAGGDADLLLLLASQAQQRGDAEAGRILSKMAHYATKQKTSEVLPQVA